MGGRNTSSIGTDVYLLGLTLFECLTGVVPFEFELNFDDAVVSKPLPPIDGDEASLVALLSDGAAWSTSALALAVGASQRTVQRALVELEAAGRVRSIGRARTRRWLAPPLAGFTTILLLPAALSPE